MVKESVKNAFDKLEKNKDALLGNEKADLQKLTTDDVMASKDWLKTQKFDLGGGVSITLEEAVKSYVSAKKSIKKGNTFYPVKLNSDLAAAMQLYLISDGISVSTNGILTADAAKGIDGSIGSATHGAINSYNTKHNNRGVDGGIDINQSKDIVNIGDICDRAVVSYIEGVGGRPAYYEGLGIISSTTGKLTPTNLSTFARDKKLTFKYKISNKNVEFSIPIRELNSNHDVNLKTLVENIVKEARKQQIEKSNESKFDIVQKGINEFNEKDITNPLIKEWAKLDGVNFWARFYNNREGKVTIADLNHKTKTSLNREIKYEELITNGKFDVNKFNKRLTSLYSPVAVRVVNQDIIKRNNADPQPSSILTTTFIADREINARQKLINEIDSYVGYAGSFRATKTEVKKKIERYKNQKDYLEAKNKVVTVGKEINRLGGNANSFIQNFDAILTQMKRIVGIKKVPNVKFTYEINYATDLRGKFDKAGKKNEYTALVDLVINHWKNIKEGGDAKYDLTVINR